MKMLIAAAAVLFAAPVAAQEPAATEVMVLGTYHMGNPGQDLANVEADDSTSPARQRQLVALADALARWKPDRILIEWQRPPPFTVQDYRAFTPAMLASDRNEIVQIGFRLAHRLGHEDVYGFDEQPSEGEPDYFPFGKVSEFAAAHGESRTIEDLLAHFKASAAAQGEALKTGSVAEMLLADNDPAALAADHRRGYYAMLAIGDGTSQPGAELNAYWYMRNAKMFAKIASIGKPGERLLVLVGTGHGYWLNHFAEQTPGFTRVDPRPWLMLAANAGR